MSEKETTESVEEVQEEATEEVQEQEASSQESPAEEQVEAPEEESVEEVEASAEDSKETVPETPVVKKGLMERRPSYSQSSVPNAHRGYSETPPVIMLLIISVFILLSIIFATSAVIN